MSADNWDVCPRCKQKADADFAALQLEADAAYGKLPVDEYLALREKSLVQPTYKQSWREDYEIGLTYDTSVFYVDYKGACGDCGLRKVFKHEEPIQFGKE